jgi:hypothetical protein
MRRLISTLIMAAIGLILVFGTACSGGQQTSTTPPAGTPTITTARFALSDEAAQQYSEEFITNTSTFKFDGIPGSLKIIKAEDGNNPAYLSTVYTIEYQTQHPGHGDRKDQFLAQVVTTHTTVILINRDQPTVAKAVVSAVCDNTWDLLTDKSLVTTVSGVVTGGGDTTPAGGPLDAPRTFTYEILKDDGTSVSVSYTAYPPSPAGDAARKQIVLSFRGGSIQAGDYLSAHGTYDQVSNTVIVENPGDYIFTTVTDAGAQSLATDFMQNENTTFAFDGIPGSLKLVATGPGWTSSFRSTAFTFTYQTQHPGHGDRTGQMLALVITDHSAVVLVDIEKGEVASAVCDRTWDMLNNKDLPVYISGFVVSGGDTTSVDGPLDTPRMFVYQVQKADGSIVNVSYMGYPPSPVGDAYRAKVTLDFYAGSIQIGDRIDVSGMLNKETNTIVIADQGGYIRTSVPKIEVTGQVLSGGDIPDAGGLLDAPRIFTYQIRKDDGTTVHVSYTAYPPSPAVDAAMAKIILSYYDGAPKAGDYLKAYGTYAAAAGTVTVVDQGDFIKTYPEKP